MTSAQPVDPEDWATFPSWMEVDPGKNGGGIREHIRCSSRGVGMCHFPEGHAGVHVAYRYSTTPERRAGAPEVVPGNYWVRGE